MKAERRQVLRTLLRITARAAVSAAVAILLAFLNPFEITHWTEMRSHELWERIQAPSYDDPIGHEAVSIVYLDEGALKQAALTRPLKLRDHEAMLEDVVRPGQPVAAPEAVLVDFAFDQATDAAGAAAALKPFGQADLTACDRAPAAPEPGAPGADRFRCYLIKVASLTRYSAWAGDPACGLNEMARILCIRDAGGVPVIFTSSAPPALNSDAAPALQALGQVALVTSAQVSTSDGYWLVTPVDPGKRENQPFRLSPAAALYAVFCFDRPSFCKTPPYVREVPPSAPEWSTGFQRPLQVVWGLGHADLFSGRQKWRHTGAIGQGCQAAGGLLGTLGEAGRLFASGLNTRRQLGCAYAHATPYADLDNANMTERDLNDVLADKLVLIGGQFSDGDDWVPAPPQGQLPGVHYHAMALDNLIRYGASYPKVLPGVFGGAPTQDDLIAIFFGFLASFVVLSVRAGMNEPELDPASPETLGGKTQPQSFWRSAWFKRGVLYAVTTASMFGIAVLLLDGHLHNFNTVMFVLLMFSSLPGLTGEFWRPWVYRARRHSIARFLDVENIRWRGPDIKREPRPTAAQEVVAKPAAVKEVAVVAAFVVQEQAS